MENETQPDSTKNSTKNNSSVLMFMGIVVAGALIASAIYFSSNKKASIDNNKPSVKNDSSDVSTGDQKSKRVDIAKEIGLNGDDFKKCTDANDKTSVTKDIESAKALGKDIGTPTFVIGKVNGNEIEGQVLIGAQPFDAFKKVVDSWLSGKPYTGKDIPEDYLSPNTVKVSLEGPVKGDINSKFAILEYSDYECPFCKRYVETTLKQITEEYITTNKIKYVFRNFPLYFHDPVATEVAIAANCAKSLGGDAKYYEYHDKYFEKTNGNGKGL